MKRILKVSLTTGTPSDMKPNKKLASTVNSTCHVKGEVKNLVYTPLFSKDFLRPFKDIVQLYRKKFDSLGVKVPGERGIRYMTPEAYRKWLEFSTENKARVQDIARNIVKGYERERDNVLKNLADTPSLLAHYPPVQEFSVKFEVGTKLIGAVPTPDMFSDFSQEERDEIESQAQADMLEARKETYSELLGVMMDCLNRTQSEDSIRSARRGAGCKRSVVQALEDFIEVAGFKNLSDDSQFDGFTDKIKELIKGVDIDDLKESDEMREDFDGALRRVHESVKETRHRMEKLDLNDMSVLL